MEDNHKIIDIEKIIVNEPSYMKIMDDGIITDDELKEQTERVINLMHEAEQHFNDSDLELIKRLIAETNVLSTIFHYYELQNLQDNGCFQ